MRRGLDHVNDQRKSNTGTHKGFRERMTSVGCRFIEGLSFGISGVFIFFSREASQESD